MTGIQELIDALRQGKVADVAEHVRVLAAALRDQKAGTPLLVELLDSALAALRIAALQACVGRGDPEVSRRVAALAGDPEAEVRRRVVACVAAPGFPGAEALLGRLAGDEDATVRTAAIEASALLPEMRPRILAILSEDASWEVRLTAARAAALRPEASDLPVLLRRLALDEDADVRQQLLAGVDEAVGRGWHETAAVQALDGGLFRALSQRLKDPSLRGRYRRVVDWVAAHAATVVDTDLLAAYGTDLSRAAGAESADVAFGVDAMVERLRELLTRKSRRSVVLLGESGVGKTALVEQLARVVGRPENGGWHVLRMMPSDFLTGTRFLGEWETRLSALVEAIRAPRRVILYVQNLGELSSTGSTSNSQANVARALAPHLEDGSVLVLGESTPREFEQGLGSSPSLARLFDPILVPEAGPEATREVLEGIRDAAGATIAGPTLSRLAEMAEAFLCQFRRPGNAAGLLRAVLARHAASAREITVRDCITTLSHATGVPPDLLDDGVPLDAEAVRRHFESRILGQPEAVDAVVDLVTLVKAGLTDPEKPLGVMLFVGPTGVGKTELARALAEYLFGDPARLRRYDMSEYASPEAFQRLIGVRGSNGLLTDAVRQQPFSVVLLDEIEKGHLNVFDLCLQLFDAGRLTDGLGRTIDFRRSIIILTSNIGAQVPGAELGFGAARGQAEPQADPDRTWRELTRFFRPEFLNRIDRIVNFRPLSLEATERIVQRETRRVLERSGIVRRQVTVNVDPSVTTLLLREGWSPHFGARPVKRTVERMLLLPLARLLAGGVDRRAGVVSLVSREGRIETHWQPAPQPPAPVPPAAVPRRATVRAARRRLDDLEAEWDTLAAGLEGFRARKSALVERTQEKGFFGLGEVRARVLDELHGIEQFLALAERARHRLERLRSDAAQPAPSDDAAVADLCRELEAELGHLRYVVGSGDPRGLGDALVVVTRVPGRAGTLEGVPRLSRMLQAFAQGRRLTAEFVAERFDETLDAAYLEVSGLGAFGLLVPEAGLHRLASRGRGADPKSGRERVREQEETVRVEVLPAAGEPPKGFAKTARLRWRALAPPRSRLLEGLSWEVGAFDPKHARGVEVWTFGTRAAASERILRVLHTLESAPVPAEAADVVRTYELGIGSRIRDHRTGKATPRLGPVFKGHLELLR